MSKYVNLRPAGMSDDEEDDFFFENEYERDSKCDYVSTEAPKQEGTAINFKKCKILETRVMKACTTGNLEEIEEYCKKYNINEFLYTGWTPLLYATSSIQPEAVEYLLANGANPNMHKDGFTPLMGLCNSKGATEKSLQCLELLIKAKANVNTTNRRRETALMYACKSQDAEFVAELIKHVKDINTCDSDGKTALSYATAVNNVKVVKILLEHDVDASIKDVHNVSAKDIANIKGFIEISALLDEDEEIPILCKMSQIATWRDLFPDMSTGKEEELNYDISDMLYGMGLEGYNSLFQGMDLKTFLQLTEDDISRLGIDITVHQEQFLENLEKFHNRKWRSDSLGIIRKTVPYTIYNGVISLANVKKQIGVIASSFVYIKNNLIKAASENIDLSPTQRVEYEEELRKTQKTLKNLKNEIMKFKKLSLKIDKENNIGTPATFISAARKKKSNWTIMLSITLMVGLCLCKTTCIQRLWSVYNIRL